MYCPAKRTLLCLNKSITNAFKTVMENIVRKQTCPRTKIERYVTSADRTSPAWYITADSLFQRSRVSQQWALGCYGLIICRFSVSKHHQVFRLLILISILRVDVLENGFIDTIFILRSI